MTTDYLVASLPTLCFDQPAPLTWAAYVARIGNRALPERWSDLETQLRNAMAEARGGAQFCRPTPGCSLYWKNRMLACFQEKDIARRETLIDRVWWDAAGELTPPDAPLGAGALATYTIRLKIALKRSKISQEKGNEAFDRLTAETRI